MNRQCRNAHKAAYGKAAAQQAGTSFELYNLKLCFAVACCLGLTEIVGLMVNSLYIRLGSFGTKGELSINIRFHLLRRFNPLTVCSPGSD